MHLIFWADQEMKDFNAQLKRIENKIDALILSMASAQEIVMAEQQEIDNLKSKVQQNTDAVSSAQTALQGFVGMVQDLTQKLQDAISQDNSAAIKAAADALDANNSALLAAIPPMAQAVAANTKK